MRYNLTDLDKITYVINHKDGDLEIFPPNVHTHQLEYLERVPFDDTRVQSALKNESTLRVWWSFDLRLLDRFGHGEVYHPSERGLCGFCGSGNFIGGSGTGVQYSVDGIEGYRCVFCKNIKDYHWRLGPIAPSNFGKYSHLNEE